jgi:hypothetical protein
LVSAQHSKFKGEITDEDPIFGFMQKLSQPIERWVSLNPQKPSKIGSEEMVIIVRIGPVYAWLLGFEFLDKFLRGAMPST